MMKKVLFALLDDSNGRSTVNRLADKWFCRRNSNRYLVFGVTPVCRGVK